MTTPNELLQAALTYAGLGWAIHPLQPGDKRPLVKDWPHQATTDPDKIRAWWQQWPGANIGLACGAGLAVIDLDVKAGADGLASWAALGITGDTLTSRTPSGGRHLLYSSNGTAIRNTAGKLGRGIDTRGDGGYIVLPPSTLSDGRPWAWERSPQDCPPANIPGALVAMLAEKPKPDPRPAGTVATPANAAPYAHKALQGELDRLGQAREGERNPTLYKAACNLGELVGAGLLDRGQVESNLERVALGIGLGEVETQKTIKSGLDKGELNPRQVPERGPLAGDTEPPRAEPGPIEGPTAAATPSDLAAVAEAPPVGGYNLTDLGNAGRFVGQHAGALHWCDPWGCWLAWDGRRWAIDQSREVERLGVATVRSIYQEAANEPDADRRAALGRWAFKCEGVHKQRAMIDVARALLPMPILPDQLDADPWLLACNNGALDLRTGKLRPPDPGALITRLAPVDYDPAAEAPTWAAFLARIMAGNTDLIAFLQRAIGYSLTGDTREQVLFILHGTGANGKSTLLEALGALLGEYATKTPTETLLMKRSGGIPADVARLRGARLVTAVEAEEGQRLAESLVKQMTGGDTLTARRLYSDFFEFKPRFKLWLATNHKPTIRGTDLAIWRRIRLIPFVVTIPDEEQDLTLLDKLTAELPGILAWAVAGCLDWQRQGLGTPAEVRQATASYQTEQDTLAGFLEDCCKLGPGVQVTVKALYEAYQAWCKESGEEAETKRDLGRRLRERGLDQEKGTGGARLWRRIGLLDGPEQLSLDSEPPQERKL